MYHNLNQLKPALTDILATLWQRKQDKYKRYIIIFKVGLLANSCLSTHPADTEQPEHSFVVMFVAIW